MWLGCCALTLVCCLCVCSASAAARRKSMPAAIDMALRSPEGRAQLEEVLKGGNRAGSKKQMVFGQYFGGASRVVPPEVVQPPQPASSGSFTRLSKANMQGAAVRAVTGKRGAPGASEDAHACHCGQEVDCSTASK